MRRPAFAALAFLVLGSSAVALADPAPGRASSNTPVMQRTATSIGPLLGVTRVILPRVTPGDAQRIIQSRVLPADLNPRGSGLKALQPTVPPSIVELARALRNDVDLIYEHVRNNVEYYPIWGVQKGPLGAILDGQGTAFDQAALMVALLRQAGHTASFIKGEIDLTPAQVGSWLGVSTANGCAVATLIDQGQIPIVQAFTEIGGCSALASIRLEHVWVKAVIGGTAYFFDPSFKPHTIKPGVNLATATGYNATTYLSSAKSGSTVTADYIQNVNRANIRANLTTLANSLATYVRTNLPAGELADLLGGVSITPHAGGNLRQTALPYQHLATPVTEWADIPAGYKPTLRIQHLGIDATFTTDVLSGTRLSVSYNGTNHAVLSLDGATVATSTGTLAPGSPGTIVISIAHNAYVSTSVDQSFGQSVRGGGTYVIVNGWGPVGRGPVELHRTRLDTAKASGLADGSETVLGSSLAVLGTTWMAQANRANLLIDRIAATTSTYHHQVGIAGYDTASYVDLPGNIIGTTSQTNNTADEDAAFYSQVMHSSVFESVAVEQMSGISAVSTVKLIDLAVSGGLRIYDATSANYSANVEPNLIGCASSLPVFQSIMAAGDRLVMPNRCDITENDWEGTGFFEMPLPGQTGGFGSIIFGGLNGGQSTLPQSATALITNTLENSTTPGEAIKSTDYSYPEPIDMTKGHYLYERVDMMTGIGSYPRSLPFQRLYASGSRTNAGPLGKGWTHNFAMSTFTTSDGIQGLGEDSALDAVGAVAEAYVAFDLLKDASKPLDKMVVATVGQRWFGDQLIANTVIVRQGLNGRIYVKLPDGSYNAPPGESSKLTRNIDTTYKLEAANKALLNFNLAGKIASHVQPNGLQVNFTYAGNDLTQVQNSLGRTLTLTNSGSRISSLTDGTRTVSYTYDAATGNLTKFTDALANETNFQYDLPGRLTRFFYPSFPATPFVINEYDSLGRVMTQTSASGKVWNYFFAGTRSEEVAPDGSSHVSYVDAMGKVTRSIDPSGRVTTNIFDAQSRVVRTVLPEGNAVEYDYDDATCAAQQRCTHNVKTTRWIAKPASGQPTLTSNYVYESTFNRLASETDPRGNTTDSTYTAQGDLLQMQRPPDPSSVRPQMTYTYTAFSPGGFPTFYLPTKVTTLLAPGDSVDTTLSYNAGNRYVPQNKVVDAGAGRLNLTTAYTFDAVGNLTQIDGPRSDVVDVVGFAYDAERRLTQTTDPLSRQARMAYDADGRPVREAAQLGAQWMVTCRSYEPTGNLLAVWGQALTASDATCPAQAPPNTVSGYEYDNLDRMLRVTAHLPAPDGGNRVTEVVYYPDGKVQAVKKAAGAALAQNEAVFTYTGNKLLATVTDAKNNRTTYAYDGLDRRVKTFFPDKVMPNTSSATDFEQYDYDLGGNIVNFRRRTGQNIAIAWDNLNRMASRTYPNAADNVNISYDLIGRPLSANFANGSHNLTSVWDRANRLTSTTAGGRTIGYLHDPGGNRIRTTWPEATPFYVTTDYDALNRPTVLRELGTTALATYGYDDLSRRTSVSYGNSTTTGWGYDNRGNLSSIAHDLAGSAQDLLLTYSRNQRQEIANVAFSNSLYEWGAAAPGNAAFAANGLNQYTSIGGAAQTYDASGNLVGNGVWSYSYDDDNRLRTANGSGVAAAFAWDAIGRLRQTTIGGTATQLLYDGARLIAEYDGSNTLLRRYVHGPSIDEPIVNYEGAGTGGKTWNYADQLGSIVARANGTGNATATHSYGPFGESGPTAPGRFGYTGQQFIGPVNLYHYKTRFYSPGSGRFLQTDPSGFGGGINVYAYARNAPIGNKDPWGLRDVIAVVWDAAYGSGSVGHVVLAETDGRIIGSSFPFPHGKHGAHETKTWQETLNAEQRPPDGVFKINIPDETAFDTAAATERARKDWDWLPTNADQTNCTVFAFNSLDAGGIKIKWPWTPPYSPSDFIDEMNRQAGVTDSGVTTATKVPWK